MSRALRRSMRLTGMFTALNSTEFLLKCPPCYLLSEGPRGAPPHTHTSCTVAQIHPGVEDP